ncbi:hypothetical protein [Flavobacterium sp. UBA4197]|uniref:hypothetical protein n=1 Tax=Flavobacterium sp. UBA4197 TaxID=1946546 RepID=UPI00257EEC10|nr:hypothetical protein [Flavobacterium sp. UBA4197]
MRIEQNKTVSFHIGFIRLVMLSLLLILASCNTKKSIHTILDVPLTKTLNLSQTVYFDKSDCSFTENSESFTFQQQHTAVAYLVPEVPVVSCSGFTRNTIGRLTVNPEYNSTKKRNLHPLYLLYKKQKIALL